VPYVEVSGTGVVQVSPDRAAISFAVETQAASAADASTENATSMDAVVQVLRGLDVRGLDVETFGYALRPDYAQRGGDPQGARVIAGYTALNNIRVTVEDIQAVGRVVDAAIAAGANRVASLSFSATDTDAARREALARAVTSARAQAAAMAAALGRELGDPLEVRGGAEAPSPLMRAESMVFMRAAPDTPVEAGDLDVTASVTIRFALGGPAGMEGR
jgi:uncharacterized protein YggE